jgi:hypothetical protein
MNLLVPVAIQPSSDRNSQLTPLEDPAETIDKTEISMSSLGSLPTFTAMNHSVMHQNGHKLFVIPTDDNSLTANGSALPWQPPLQ